MPLAHALAAKKEEDGNGETPTAAVDTPPRQDLLGGARTGGGKSDDTVGTSATTTVALWRPVPVAHPTPRETSAADPAHEESGHNRPRPHPVGARAITTGGPKE